MANNVFGGNGDNKGFANPFAGENGLLNPDNNPFMRKSNPFFPPEEEKGLDQQQPFQLPGQLPAQLPAQLAQGGSMPQQMQQMQQAQQPQMQQFMQPQAQFLPQQQQFLQPNAQYGQPQQSDNTQAMFGQQQFAPQVAQPDTPASLPQKAFNFLSNIKGMIQEGKNTVDAVRMALQGPAPADQQGYPQPQFMPQQAYGQPMMQMQPQQQYGLQSLMQTQAQTTPPVNQDLLSTLAGLLGGNNANANNPMAGHDHSQDLGLANLAQWLATTTGTANSALPQPVQTVPGADSAALGMQEMQNMIQEAQRP